MKIKLSPMHTKTFVHGPTGSTAKVIGAHDYGARVYVTGVHTPAEHRGKGGAHEVMKQVTDHLDTNGHEASLRAVATDDHVSIRRLVKFYGKHGFVKNGPMGDMKRYPKPDTDSGER